MTAWKPSWKWHLRTLGILLALCIAIFGGLCLFTKNLPESYQAHTPAQGTTPWKE